MKYIIKDSDTHIFQNRFYDFGTKQLLSPIETQNYVVVQVAQSLYNRGFSTAEHNQFCDLELTFSHTNSLLCSSGATFEKVDKFGLYISLRGENHTLKSTKKAAFQTLAINFKEGPSHALLHAISEKTQTQRVFYAPSLVMPIDKILNEFRLSDAMFFETNLDALITSVLVRIARLDTEETLDEILSYDEKLSAMKTYIDTHFLQIFSLDELSSAFGYSYSHISKSFKKTYEITPSDYLAKKKNEYACNLLKDGAELDEVSDILGYSSVFNFSRAFKAQNGISPSNYKKQSEANK